MIKSGFTGVEICFDNQLSATAFLEYFQCQITEILSISIKVNRLKSISCNQIDFDLKSCQFKPSQLVILIAFSSK